MAVAYGSQSNTGWVGSSDVTVTKPTGLAVGDLMIFWLVSSGGTVDPVNLSGWTYIGYQGIGGPDKASYVCYKYATSGDVAASNFTWTGTSSGGLGAIIRITGASNLSSLIVTSATDVNKTTNTSTPSFTGITPPSRGNNLILQLWYASTSVSSIDTYAIATSNPSWTEILDVASGTSFCASAAYGLRPQTTATGNFSCVGGSGTTDWNGWIIGITGDQNVVVSDSMTMTDSKTQKTMITRTDSISISDSVVGLAQRIWTTVSKNISTWINQNKS